MTIRRIRNKKTGEIRTFRRKVGAGRLSDARAQTIGEEVDLMRANDPTAVITAEAFVARVRHVPRLRSMVPSWFWDDTKAAEIARNNWARNCLNAYEGSDGKPANYAPSSVGGYVDSAAVEQSISLRKEMLSKMSSDLKAFARRYAQLRGSHTRGLFAAIDAWLMKNEKPKPKAKAG